MWCTPAGNPPSHTPTTTDSTPPRVDSTIKTLMKEGHTFSEAYGCEEAHAHLQLPSGTEPPQSPMSIRLKLAGLWTCLVIHAPMRPLGSPH